MEKKNTVFVIVIVALALVVGIFGSYIISEKLTNKDNKTNENNHNDGNDIIDKDYSLSDAKSLMSKYIIGDCSTRYIDSLSDNNIKLVSILNSKSSEVLKCKDIDNGALTNLPENFMNGVEDMYSLCLSVEDDALGHGNNLYKYNEVLSQAKTLFGTTVSVDNKTFDYERDVYYYSTGKKGFVHLMIPSGCGANPDAVIVEPNVSSVNVVNNILEIVAYYRTAEDSATQTHKYTFKKENNNYYLSSIIDVK